METGSSAEESDVKTGSSIGKTAVGNEKVVEKSYDECPQVKKEITAEVKVGIRSLEFVAGDAAERERGAPREEKRISLAEGRDQRKLQERRRRNTS